MDYTKATVTTRVIDDGNMPDDETSCDWVGENRSTQLALKYAMGQATEYMASLFDENGADAFDITVSLEERTTKLQEAI